MNKNLSRQPGRSFSPVLSLFMLAAVVSLPAAAAGAAESTPEKIELWTGPAPVGDGTFVTAKAFITVHRPAQANGTAVVICPGGGYGGLVVNPEGHGIARWLNPHGIVGVVLEYRLPHGSPFVPLLDAQRALRLVRSHAKEWPCDPARVGIMGFSAGGHLAAMAATHFDGGDAQAADPVKKLSCRAVAPG